MWKKFHNGRKAKHVKKTAERVGVNERYVSDAKKIKAENPELCENQPNGIRRHWRPTGAFHGDGFDFSHYAEEFFSMLENNFVEHVVGYSLASRTSTLRTDRRIADDPTTARPARLLRDRA